jgi:O-antigen/teichoic acid export membrane protein
MYLILTRFLSGQLLVQSANVLAGILVLWVLPVSEYALYVIALLFTSMVSVVGNMGISQAVATFGAKLREDRVYLGTLYLTGLSISKLLFWIAAVCALLLSMILFWGKSWSLWVMALVFVLAVLIGFLQNRMALKQAVLNIQHDDKALFIAGVGGSAARLLASLLFLAWPNATVALLGNLIGALLTNLLMTGSVGKYAYTGLTESHEARSAIIRFITPLAPAIVYFAIKDQISILILGFSDQIELIAEVGALGRLGQIIILLMALNPFFIQPYFARIREKSRFLVRLSQVCLLLLIFSASAILSSILFPDPWLAILGGHYAGLLRELPIAVSGGLLTLIGGTLYTIVVSKGDTGLQSWSVVLGVGCQLLFVGVNGVQTAMDALYLNLLPAASYLCLQGAILVNMLQRWKDD